MAQVKIKEPNIYFLQSEKNAVKGMYADAEFIKVNVDRMLAEDELRKLGEDIYDACMKNKCIRTVIQSYADEYNCGNKITH